MKRCFRWKAEILPLRENISLPYYEQPPIKTIKHLLSGPAILIHRILVFRLQDVRMEQRTFLKSLGAYELHPTVY